MMQSNDHDDVLDLIHPLHRCPACRAETLTAVTDGDVTNFVCEECGRCWHLELGWVHRVDPRTCGGCGREDRCIDVWSADHPEAVR
jgi:hypothetical protein